LGIDETNVACDPLCMLPDVAKQWVNGVQAQCHQNLCIIDNVAINIINSKESGGINFNVVCGCGQGSGTCRCVFSDISIFQENSSILGGLNFQSNCGSCVKPDPANQGNFINISCDTGLPIGPISPDTFLGRIIKWFESNKMLFLFLIVIVIIIGIVIWFIFIREPTKIKKSLGDKVTLNDLFGEFSSYLPTY
jgi:hypothetical protein